MLSVDRHFMRRALALARRGYNLTGLNPLVGALIVKDGKLISKGFHKSLSDDLVYLSGDLASTSACASPHAEVDAIGKANPEDVRGSTMYVTLEPCNHHGRTGPCTEAILAAGISRVVFSMKDPNPGVKGGGAEFLEKAGVEVLGGVLEREASLLNRPWLQFLETGRPHLTLKLACFQGGELTDKPGQRYTISSSPSLARVQRSRALSQAILVGRNTVQVDKPFLSNRSRGGAQPLKLILDKDLLLNPSIGTFQDSRVIIFTSKESLESSRSRAFSEIGCELRSVGVKQGGLDLLEVLSSLTAQGIRSILCEGGGCLARSLLSERLVDRLEIYRSPKVVELHDNAIRAWSGGLPSREELGEQLELKSKRPIGPDELLVYEAS